LHQRQLPLILESQLILTLQRKCTRTLTVEIFFSAFLHQRHPPLIHRDLKPSNLLLTRDGRLKVADFGLATIVRVTGKMGDSYAMTGGKGTLRYMAPEVLLNECYNSSVDVYSFALVLWYMCTGTKPLEAEMRKVFDDATLQLLGKSLKEGLRPDIKRITIPALRSLIQGMWASESSVRPTAAGVLITLEAIATDVKAKLHAKVATKDPNPLDSKGRPLPKGVAQKCCVS
jgi:serine/threonine protein kinase